MLLKVNQDFVQLMADLKAKRVTAALVASTCGVTSSCISDVANGNTVNPSWETGATIVRMHQRYVQGEN